MKKLLEKLVVFKFFLKIYAFLGQRSVFDKLTQWLTSMTAKLNVKLNQPGKGKTTQELATKWQEMMPPDGQEYFTIEKVDEKTAVVKIHLHCPLQGTGNNHACHKLMNYDRKLMENVGGQLVVLESQSNSGKPACLLAIRKAGEDVSDLTPAWQP
jgi:hypothetical protein